MLIEHLQAGVGAWLLNRRAKLPPPLRTQIWYRCLGSDLWSTTLARF